MDAETALKRINQLVDLQAKQPLGYLHQRLFKGLWEGLTYAEMVSQWAEQSNHVYDNSYIRAKGSELCRLLTTFLGVKVQKSFFQDAVLKGLWLLDEQQSTIALPPQPPEPIDLRKVNPAIAELSFQDQAGECGEIRWVGRSPLLTTITQQLQADCRVLSLVGITGIGKTSLALRLMKDDTLWTEGTIFRRISFTRESAGFETLAQEILTHQGGTDLPQHDPEQQLRAVLHSVQSRPHLVVLDMVEEIMQPNGQGEFRFIDPLYEEFLIRFVRETNMASRLVLTSQDQPPICPEGRYPDRWWQATVKGLTEAESFSLFRRWEIPIRDRQDETCLRQIIQVYEGHPLALRVIIGDLRADYQGEIQLFWQEYGTEIEDILHLREKEENVGSSLAPTLYHTSSNLVNYVRRRLEKTFKRLEQDHPIAFELICQGSIFHKPVERERWLRRIRKYSPEQQNLAFVALQKRFLLERDDSYRPYRYRLHSLIQHVAEQYREKFEQN